MSKKNISLNPLKMIRSFVLNYDRSLHVLVFLIFGLAITYMAGMILFQSPTIVNLEPAYSIAQTPLARLSSWLDKRSEESNKSFLAGVNEPFVCIFPSPLARPLPKPVKSPSVSPTPAPSLAPEPSLTPSIVPTP